MTIDLHTHVLPGVDDGPPELAGSIELARAAAADGTDTLVATPHIDHYHRLDPRSVVALVAELTADIAAAAIAVELRSGGEIALDRAPDLDDAELSAIGLGGGPVVMLEAPLSVAAWAATIERVAAELLGRGYAVLLAHPERSPALQREPDALERMVEAGVMCQVTAGALVNEFGPPALVLSRHMLRRRLVHALASDAHHATGRPPRLARLLDGLQTDETLTHAGADWLGETAPAAILRGERPSEMPELTASGAGDGAGPLGRLRRSWRGGAARGR